MPYPDNPYPPPRMSDGEIRALFDALRTEVRSGFDATTRDLSEVKAQTTKTNGRVDRLESYRDKLLGAFLVLAILQPAATALLVAWITGR